MASTNQSPFYKAAEVKFLQAITDEERIIALEEMIRECPKHKSSENMLANLKTRLKKFVEKQEKSKKSGKGSKQGIKKSEIQAIILGPPNTGKSSIFKTLAKQNSKISQTPYTTIQPQLGTTLYENAKIQIIDLPPLSAIPNEDKNLITTADTILFVIDNIKQLDELNKNDLIKKFNKKTIIIFNKSDNLNEQEKHKITETLKSKKQNFVFFSQNNEDKNNAEIIKEKIFSLAPIIRIYTKEPKKPATKEPMLLKQNSTPRDVAEKILKGMSKKVRRIKIWGPSSKFSGQIIGLEHLLKDKDTVEFQTT